MPSSPTPDEDDACLKRHRQRLDRLADVGMRLVEAFDAGLDDTVAPSPEAARTFAHISRAVRQTIALDAKLMRDVQRRRLEAERDRWREEAWIARRGRKDEVRDALRQVVAETPAAPAKLKIERYIEERLESDHDTRDAVFAHKPIGEILVRLCADLGLDPDWSAFDEPWAEEAQEVRTRLVGDGSFEIGLRRWNDDGEEIEPEIIVVRPSG